MSVSVENNIHVLVGAYIIIIMAIKKGVFMFHILGNCVARQMRQNGMGGQFWYHTEVGGGG